MSKIVALVTGSNRGIGAICIEEFAKQGVNVIINYCHHEKEAKDLERYIKSNYSVDVLTIKCDISKEEEVEKMVNEIIDHFGGIDILVNNAAVSRPAGLGASSLDFLSFLGSLTFLAFLGLTSTFSFSSAS